MTARLMDIDQLTCDQSTRGTICVLEAILASAAAAAAAAGSLPATLARAAAREARRATGAGSEDNDPGPFVVTVSATELFTGSASVS